MRIISDLDEMTQTARGWLSGGSVGFVPTRGNLHAGKLVLVQAARRECEITVVSIFHDSQEESPPPAGIPAAPPPTGGIHHTSTAQDLQLLSTSNVDVVFLPHAQNFYPPDFSTLITFSNTTQQNQKSFAALIERLEGVRSPAYLRRVASELTKFLQLVRPDVVFFGQKDAQQVAIARKLVYDLNIDIRLRILPVVREHDGLALSSCNALLSPAERQAAPTLYRALLAGKAAIEQGEYRPAAVEKAMADVLARESLVKPDYIAVCHIDSFQEIEKVVPGTLLAIAAHIGPTRLVDNVLWQKDGQWLI